MEGVGEGVSKKADCSGPELRASEEQLRSYLMVVVAGGQKHK